MQGNEFVRNGMYRQGPLPFQPVGQALCRLLQKKVRVRKAHMQPTVYGDDAT